MPALYWLIPIRSIYDVLYVAFMIIIAYYIIKLGNKLPLGRLIERGNRRNGTPFP